MSNTRAARRRAAQGKPPVELLEPDVEPCDISDEIERMEDADMMNPLEKLTKDELDRTYEMISVQKAFIDIMRLLKDPVDERGVTYDLRPIPAHVRAIAWTLTLLGFRRTCAKCGHHFRSWIKPRKAAGAGTYADAQTWVDIRSPDTAEEELKPEHDQHDRNLPPDTRAAAARRDGDDGMEPTPEWHTTAEVKFMETPRPEDWDYQ